MKIVRYIRWIECEEEERTLSYVYLFLVQSGQHDHITTVGIFSAVEMNPFFSVLCYNSIIVFLNLMLDSMWKIASSTIICVFICRIRSIMLNGIVHHIIIEPPMIHRLWSLSCQKYLCVHSYSLYNNEVIFILLGFIVSSHGLKSTLLSPDGRGMNMHIGLGHA